MVNNLNKGRAATILSCYSNVDTILKSEDKGDLEKGGEGSRGGKVIGHTQSGKPIYETSEHTKKVLKTLDKHVSVNHTPDENGHHEITYAREELGRYEPENKRVVLTNNIGYYQDGRYNVELGPHQGRFERDLENHEVHVHDEDYE